MVSRIAEGGQKTGAKLRPIPHIRKRNTNIQPVADNKSITFDEQSIQPANKTLVPFEPRVTNIVSVSNLGVELDLKLIAKKARNTSYDPKRFNGCRMHMRDPKCSAILFSSGKFVVAGTKTLQSSKRASRRVERIVKKLGFEDAELTDWRAVNLVASASLGFEIDLERLRANPSHNNYMTYEPEVFPALVYRMLKPKLTFVLFYSGRMTITGAKCEEDIEEAFELFRSLALLYRRK